MKCNREYKPGDTCDRFEGHEGECFAAYDRWTAGAVNYKDHLRICREEHRRLLDMVCEICELDRTQTNIIAIERHLKEFVNARKTARKAHPRGGPNPALADRALARLGYPPRVK